MSEVTALTVSKCSFVLRRRFPDSQFYEADEVRIGNSLVICRWFNIFLQSPRLKERVLSRLPQTFRNILQGTGCASRSDRRTHRRNTEHRARQNKVLDRLLLHFCHLGSQTAPEPPDDTVVPLPI